MDTNCAPLFSPTPFCMKIHAVSALNGKYTAGISV